MKKSIILTCLLFICLIIQVSAETVKEKIEVLQEIAIKADSFDKQNSFILYSMNETSTAILK